MGIRRDERVSGRAVSMMGLGRSHQRTTGPPIADLLHRFPDRPQLRLSGMGVSRARAGVAKLKYCANLQNAPAPAQLNLSAVGLAQNIMCRSVSTAPYAREKWKFPICFQFFTKIRLIKLFCCSNSKCSAGSIKSISCFYGRTRGPQV